MQRLHAAAILALPSLMTMVAAPVSGQGHSPQIAAAKMTPADGFRVDLVASEPLVRQPVCIEFDDRGRLWVIQYLQYPNPSDLRRIKVDRYSRTQYDRVPKPPPLGPRGSDRITILQDTDGDGLMDKGHDFVDGLNLASGIAFGHGGVFVLNVPYLLFYPDRDRDDVPDGDPEVLLKGFGMQDAHSVANSLTWGPDGWLYGCQGSTVTAAIRGIEFQQGVWRYHPVTKKFELFCEGGGNSWGLDFDREGNLFYSTNYGGYLMLHGVQGGYFVKSFAKHGELHNPYAYGFFDHVPHANFQGGHVTVGGIVYQGDTLPESFRGKLIAADLLGHAVNWHPIDRRGSTFATRHGGELLQANDRWFAPTDLTMGPDGAIYVADWHDRRTAHPDPDAQWDRSNGRIYRIAAADTPPVKPIDFAQQTLDQLLENHRHPSQWYVRKARQELVRRNEPSALVRLRQRLLAATDGQEAIESLWSLYSLAGLDETLAMRLLDSPHRPVRYWTLRYLGDVPAISAAMAERLDELAEQEPDVWVRQQLACTAARLPASQAIPLVNANIIRDIDHQDPYLPWLWWWAVERHSVTGREEVLRRFVRPSAWRSKLGRDFLLPRLVRRYTAEATPAGFDSVARLLQAAPDVDAQDRLWQPILDGWRQANAGDLSRHDLATRIDARWQAVASRDALATYPALAKLAIVCGNRPATERTVAIAVNEKVTAAQRVQALETLAVADVDPLQDVLVNLLKNEPVEAIRLAALELVARIDDASVTTQLIGLLATESSEKLKRRIRGVLLGRPRSALAWLRAVDRGEMAAADAPIDQVRQVAVHNDPRLDQLVRKHWGKLDAATHEQALAEVRRLNNDLRGGDGHAATGRVLFAKHCAGCHQLFGEGKRVGPDLTAANRADSNAMLISLVAPSSVIRKEYSSIIVLTDDGRVLTGVPIQRDAAGVTIVNQMGEQTQIETGDIDSIRESDVSLMPADLYRQLTPQQLRDLFAWLQSKGPVE